MLAFSNKLYHGTIEKKLDDITMFLLLQHIKHLENDIILEFVRPQKKKNGYACVSMIESGVFNMQ